VSGVNDRPSPSAGSHAPETAPHGLRHAATQALLGIIAVAVITFAATVWLPVTSLPTSGVGPGTISLLYLIVIVFVSLRAGFVCAVAVSLIAAFCLNYFILPVIPALKAKNPLDIVATVVFLTTAALITGIVARLRERTTLLDTLFEQAPQSLALLANVDMRVVRVNQEFTRVFGYTQQDAVGRSLSELIVPSEFEGESQRHTELAFRGQRVDAELVRRRKDGSRVLVRVFSVPVSLPSGQTAVYAMYTDITERKAAEAALHSLSVRLMEVQETERRHLARELHDEIGQLLTGLRLLLGEDADSPADLLRPRFEQAKTIVDDLLVRVRNLSFDLRPADLDQFGLLPALLALFERYTTQTRISVNFKHNGIEGRFASEVETAAYRVVQEALTNAARHAGVFAITVRAWTDADKLNLQVEDQGCGFDPEVVLKVQRSSGLTGMQERIMLLSGRLAIESSPGSGTTIVADLPLNKTTTA
jgi:PAS domain S-box-containing protein